MRGKDYQKIKAAGFRIFRLRERDASIWENLKGLAWSLYQRYPTQAEAKKKFNQLMKDSKNIGE